jgi:23S rRNA pseudouridine2605 synthase
VSGKPGKQGRRVQLHRAVSKLGWGSRTQAWDWIRAGQIGVDGRVVTDPLTWVDLDRQEVARIGEEAAPVTPLTLALNKPHGIVTTRSDERGRRTVYDLLSPDLPWLFPVGRLDADSEGLLILTNDSALATLLTEPEHRVAKTYHVVVAGPPTAETLQALRDGVELKEGQTRPAKVRILHQGQMTTLLEVILTEGRNRQIRRMTAALGHRVKRLTRVAIGKFALGDLALGRYRLLNATEIQLLTTHDNHHGRHGKKTE